MSVCSQVMVMQHKTAFISFFWLGMGMIQPHILTSMWIKKKGNLRMTEHFHNNEIFEVLLEKLTKYNALDKGLLSVRYASITSADCSAAKAFSFYMRQKPYQKWFGG